MGRSFFTDSRGVSQRPRKGRCDFKPRRWRGLWRSNRGVERIPAVPYLGPAIIPARSDSDHTCPNRQRGSRPSYQPGSPALLLRRFARPDAAIPPIQPTATPWDLPAAGIDRTDRSDQSDRSDRMRWLPHVTAPSGPGPKTQHQKTPARDDDDDPPRWRVGLAWPTKKPARRSGQGRTRRVGGGRRVGTGDSSGTE